MAISTPLGPSRSGGWWLNKQGSGESLVSKHSVLYPVNGMRRVVNILAADDIQPSSRHSWTGLGKCSVYMVLLLAFLSPPRGGRQQNGNSQIVFLISIANTKGREEAKENKAIISCLKGLSRGMIQLGVGLCHTHAEVGGNPSRSLQDVPPSSRPQEYVPPSLNTCQTRVQK